METKKRKESVKKIVEIIIFLSPFCLLFFLDRNSDNSATKFYLFKGEYFRIHQILTYSFFHNDWIHLLSNSILAIIIFPIAKRYYSVTRIVFWGFLGSLFGALGFLLLSSDNHYLLGLSSALFGIAVVLWLNHWKSHIVIKKINIPFYYLLFLLLGFQLISLLAQTNMSWKAHIGTVLGMTVYSFIKKKIDE